MFKESPKNIIAYVLKLLNDNGHDISKILLHKFMHFLSIEGVQTELVFEPASCAPFSLNLALELDDMVFWGELTEKNQSFTINHLDFSSRPLPQKLTTEKIDTLYKAFIAITGAEPDFKTLEVVGAVLCCIRSLEANEEEINEDTLIQAFGEWRNGDFDEDEVSSYFKKIQEQEAMLQQ